MQFKHLYSNTVIWKWLCYHKNLISVGSFQFSIFIAILHDLLQFKVLCQWEGQMTTRKEVNICVFQSVMKKKLGWF